MNRHDIWFQLLESNETVPNAIRYNHEYYDTESGFYYLRGRYYDPSIRRFTTPDPAEDGINWYAYCGNNPVDFVALHYSYQCEVLCLPKLLKVPDAPLRGVGRLSNSWFRATLQAINFSYPLTIWSVIIVSWINHKHLLWLLWLLWFFGPRFGVMGKFLELFLNFLW